MKEDRFDIRDNRPLEKDFENALRPLSFSDFSGQSKIVENLRIFNVLQRIAVSYVIAAFIALWLRKPKKI